MSPAVRRAVFPTLLALAALSIVAPYLLLAASASTAAFSPDSWAFRALADSVFQDFYRYSTLRSYDRVSEYSWSFPPAWPVLLALAGRIGASGPEAGIWLALVIAMLTALPVAWIFHQTIHRRILVLAASVTAMGGLLLFTDYFEEVAGARSIPLSVFLLLTCFGLLLHLASKRSVWPGLLLGASLGLACLTRFDSLPLALLLLAVCARWAGWRPAALAAVCFAATLSPWVLYSRAHFGVPWVSDNSAIAAAARNTRSNTYVRPAETIRSHPVLWSRKVATNTVIGAVRYFTGLRETPVTLACVAMGATALLAIRRRRQTAGTPGRPFLLLACTIVGLAGVSLTGYFDLRYYTLAYAAMTIAILSAVLAPESLLRQRRAPVLALLSFQILAATHTLTWLKTYREKPVNVFSSEWRTAGKDAVVAAGPICHQFGATTGVRTVCLPGDWPQLTPSLRARFLDQYGVTHFLLPESRTAEIDTSMAPARWKLEPHQRAALDQQAHRTADAPPASLP